jgi:hypothetical protein
MTWVYPLPTRYPDAIEPATTRAWSVRGRTIRDGWFDSIAAAAPRARPVWTWGFARKEKRARAGFTLIFLRGG